jgi:hypothetical protein
MKHGIIFKIKLFLNVGFRYFKVMRAIREAEEMKRKYP